MKTTTRIFDSNAIRDDFPIFKESLNEKPLIFFDNASTTQKPHAVIQAISDYYSRGCSNVHRGIYKLSEEASKSYDLARSKVQRFIGAKQDREILFTSGTTEAINLVAQSFGDVYVNEGDQILISEMEHHSNIVPWQMLCQRKKTELKVIPMTDQGDLDLNILQEMLTKNVKLVAISHVSNVLGTINPIEKIVQMIRSQTDAKILIDGAQAVGHLKVNVQELDSDFYVFSGHKVYGPTGIGILYGKEEWLRKMPPYQYGGGMIETVSFKDGTTFAPLPMKFEAGTPNIAGAIGLGHALDYLESFNLNDIKNHEKNLLTETIAALNHFPNLTIFAKPARQTGILSFQLNDIHAHDLATFFSREGVCVRAGHHCAMPLIRRLGVSATVRISFGIYNTMEEVKAITAALKEARRVFS